MIGIHASQLGHGSGHEPIPEKFLIHGVDVYSLLSSLPLLTSQEVQNFYRGWAGEGAPPPDNIVPAGTIQGSGPLAWFMTENRFDYG